MFLYYIFCFFCIIFIFKYTIIHENNLNPFLKQYVLDIQSCYDHCYYEHSGINDKTNCHNFCEYYYDDFGKIIR
jgi:hypothetical protein